MRGCVGAIAEAHTAIGVRHIRIRRRFFGDEVDAHLFVALIVLMAGVRQINTQPNRIFDGVVILQLLHTAAVIVLLNKRAAQGFCHLSTT